MDRLLSLLGIPALIFIGAGRVSTDRRHFPWRVVLLGRGFADRLCDADSSHAGRSRGVCLPWRYHHEVPELQQRGRGIPVRQHRQRRIPADLRLPVCFRHPADDHLCRRGHVHRLSSGHSAADRQGRGLGDDPHDGHLRGGALLSNAVNIFVGQTEVPLDTVRS